MWLYLLSSPVAADLLKKLQKNRHRVGKTAISPADNLLTPLCHWEKKKDACGPWEPRKKLSNSICPSSLETTLEHQGRAEENKMELSRQPIPPWEFKSSTPKKQQRRNQMDVGIIEVYGHPSSLIPAVFPIRHLRCFESKAAKVGGRIVYCSSQVGCKTGQPAGLWLGETAFSKPHRVPVWSFLPISPWSSDGLVVVAEAGGRAATTLFVGRRCLW